MFIFTNRADIAISNDIITAFKRVEKEFIEDAYLPHTNAAIAKRINIIEISTMLLP